MHTKLLLSVLLFSVSCPALQLPPLAAQSNLFLHNNINCSFIEIRGRATVGGNVDINTVQIGCQLYSPDTNCQSFGSVPCSANPGANPVLRVGGNLNAVNSQVFGGSVTYGGVLISAPQVVSDCNITKQAPGGAYDNEYSSLVAFQRDLSNAYASRASSGTNNAGNLVFSGTGQAVESFFIGSQTPSSLYAITLQNVSPSSTVVIFVGGESFNFANIGFQGQFQSLANKIIWSFAAVSINIRETSWFGTILAPNGFLYSTSAEFNGQVFAASYFPSSGSQCSRVNLVPFTGTFPSTSQSSPASSQQPSQQSSAQPSSAQSSAQPSSAQPTSAQTSAQTSQQSSAQSSAQPSSSTGGVQSCNGQPIYQPDLYTCATNDQGQQVLCPKNNGACGQACYNPSQYCCQSGQLRQPGQCAAQPTSQPTAQPTVQPTSQSSAQPTSAQSSSAQTSQQSSAQPSTSPGGVQSCNGQPIYQPDLYTCATNDQGQQVLCPKNFGACGQACYSTSQYCCKNGGLRQAGQC